MEKINKRESYNFEKLKVWRFATEFANEVYEATKKFPGDERFGLTSQLRKASVSISANIAEGVGRHSNIDFARFLKMSLGSVYECVTEFYIALEQNYLSSDEYNNLYNKTLSIAKMINALISSLKTNDE